MKNTNLRELIHQRVGDNLDQVAICSKSKKLFFTDLVKLPRQLQNKKVILFVEDVISLVSAFVMLDGSVNKLCPISTYTNKEDLDHLISLGDFDTVVSDLDTIEMKKFTDKGIKYINFTDLELTGKEELNLQQQNTAWLVPTSGTTSKPKLVKHYIDSLVSSAVKKNKKENFKAEVWGQFYDFTRFAGYQVLFNSLLNGHTLVAYPLNKESIDRIHFFVANHVTHISATPTQWRKILMSGIAENLSLDQIILGGEAADQTILSALKKYFPSARITHTYASTEAGLGISVSDGLAGFPSTFLKNSEGFVDIKIHDGKLFLRSSATSLGYIGERNLKDSDGWVDSGDMVETDGNRFYIVGRSSGIINIGGDKVNPEYIRQSLLSQPIVAEAHVYGRRNAITGTLLAADIQLKTDVDQEEGKNLVKEFIKSELQLKDQPRIINIVDVISTNLTGKISQRP